MTQQSQQQHQQHQHYSTNTDSKFKRDQQTYQATSCNIRKCAGVSAAKSSFLSRREGNVM